MHKMTPAPIRLAEFYIDGHDIGHFTFEPADTSNGLPSVCDPEKVVPGQFFMLSIPVTVKRRSLIPLCQTKMVVLLP